MANKPSPPLDDSAIKLFRSAISGTRRLKDPGRSHIQSTPPLPVPKHFLADERQAIIDSLSDYLPASEIEKDEDLPYARPGVPNQILRKMRNGQLVVETELDLHGLTSDEARKQLVHFLDRCKLREIRLIRIIHGKGLGSPNREPVLKQRVRAWLMQRDEVLAYCRARPADGGGGALIVLLKRHSTGKNRAASLGDLED
ncbi:MAG: Smr/MutS family protein [Pseudomonadota bacterium]|nr:Smr/MutS family protein [Pseudomonadota bacterium]